MVELARPLPGDPRYGCQNSDGTPKRAYPDRKTAKARALKGQAIYPCYQHFDGELTWHIGGRRPKKNGE